MGKGRHPPKSHSEVSMEVGIWPGMSDSAALKTCFWIHWHTESPEPKRTPGRQAHVSHQGSPGKASGQPRPCARGQEVAGGGRGCQADRKPQERQVRQTVSDKWVFQAWEQRLETLGASSPPCSLPPLHDTSSSPAVPWPSSFRSLSPHAPHLTALSPSFFPILTDLASVQTTTIFYPDVTQPLLSSWGDLPKAQTSRLLTGSCSKRQACLQNCPLWTSLRTFDLN